AWGPHSGTSCAESGVDVSMGARRTKPPRPSSPAGLASLSTGDPMSEAMYVSRAPVTPAGKLHRHALLESGAEAAFGVHGPIAEFFKLAPPTPLPLPVDY